VAIREKEKGGQGHLPVIALTALAMKGDRERCMAAGMDGYLSKPIRPQELDEVLDDYVARLGDNRAPAALTLRDPIMWVDEAELMHRLSGDYALLAELAEIFRDDYPRQLSLAYQAVEEKDAERLRRVGHTLRGALANLGAMGPCVTAERVEKIGESGDFSLAGPALTQLERELSCVLASLESIGQEVPQ
jgi:CheY-like chemotaxis protein